MSKLRAMELAAEDGRVVSIPRGCKKELGRGPELAIHDKTVSRRQISLELQEQSKEARSVAGNDTHSGISVKVLGANPVCVLHARQSTRRSNNGQEMTLLKQGDMDTLFPGDRISLSLSLPMFLTVREGGVRQSINSSQSNERAGSSAVEPMKEDMPTNAECSTQPTEDDLLGSWKNRKKKKSEPSITDDTEPVEALEKRQVRADEEVAADEEEAGIAQAVARRQKRALARRQQQEQNPSVKRTGLMDELEGVPKFESEVSKLEEVSVNTENIDPVKEFGFLVEGLEFEQYKKRHKLDQGRWVWPPAEMAAAESGSDEDDEERHERCRPSRKGKKKVDEDDEEWKGDDEEEKVAFVNTKARKTGAKFKLRSQEPSSSKKRDTVVKEASSGRKSKGRREELEDEDEADETLGGFILNDNEGEESPDDSADDEEDEDTAEEDMDEEMDEAEEEDEEDAKPNKSKRKKEEKPLCKYGKNCYRKNRDHLAEYRH